MNGVEAAEVLAAASVSRATSVFVPRANAVVAVIDQAPLMASAAPLPISVVPLNSATVLPASAEPVTVGRATLVMPSPGTPLSLAGARARAAGTPGAVSSTLRLRVAGAAGLPARSDTVARTV